MENRVLGGKYRVLDIFHSDDIQTIYLTEDITRYNLDNLIVNEFKSNDVVSGLKDGFEFQNRSFPSNFVETFEINSNYYVVGKVCGGVALDNYLSDNSLRLSDKMYIAENFLTSLSKLDSMSPLLKYLYCSPECISIVSRRNVCFNVNFKPDCEKLKVTGKEAVNKAAQVLCSVFANTPNATLESDKDNMPPSIAAIIKKCNEGQYDSFTQIHKEFKASLLYSTFIDGASVDKQIMKNIKKAQRKRTVSIFRRITAVILVLALAAGFWWLRGTGFFDKIIPSTGINQPTPSQGTNHKPVAKFTSSISKVYVGDEVTFVSKASDSDINDEIKTYKWTILRDGGVRELLSNEQNASYIFEQEGRYLVTLIVEDSNGLESDAYSMEIIVHPKQEIPPSEGTSTGEGDAK